MWMENQIFGGELQPDATFSDVFAARVVIPRSEFARLGLGEHESPRRLSACFQWCHANLGRGGNRWSVMLRHDNAALIYFARVQDAVAFFARWAADAVPEQPAALAAQAHPPPIRQSAQQRGWIVSRRSAPVPGRHGVVCIRTSARRPPVLPSLVAGG